LVWNAFADFDHLLLGSRQRYDGRAHVHGEAEVVEQLLRFATHPSAVDKRPGKRLVAEEDVLGDTQRRNQREFLEHRADARRAGLAHRTEADFCSVDADLARCRGIDAGQDGNEGRLAGAVLAEENMHFAGHQREVDPIQGSHAGKFLGYPGHLDERWHVGIGHVRLPARDGPGKDIPGPDLGPAGQLTLKTGLKPSGDRMSVWGTDFTFDESITKIFGPTCFV
jgi:hypothetical protein